MTVVANKPVENTGPPGSRDTWRKHWDKVAVLRKQTPQELALRRSDLAGAVAVLLARSAGRVTRNTTYIIHAQFRNHWGCDQAWIVEVLALREVFSGTVTKAMILNHLDFPAS